MPLNIPKEVAQAKDDLLHSAIENNPKADKELIEKAFQIAFQAHKGQTRASGEPYILHPIAVAKILAELKLDSASIATALLHDTVEDTHVTYNDLSKQFGAIIADLVDGVTKLTRIEFQTENVKQAENFRKLILAISKDIRVLLVKLADRLHNMRTLHYIPKKEKRLRIAHETMEIYSRLAERLGIQMFKNELQDLAFAEMYPEVRQSILNRLEFLRTNGSSLIDTIIEEIRDTISVFGIQGEVSGREKTSCSIWRKMQGKNVPFEQLSDIIAFRIVTPSVQECYKALGAIHSKYHMIPHEFKDYISTPKANGYQSLHTIVMGPERRFIEIQIRTQEMHNVAELGLAAHWAYKQGLEKNTEGLQFKWVRELVSILRNTASPEEFLENTRLEMYYDQVFCFTPLGDLIALPRGATPIDFAFAIHSKVGLTCMGARINGKIVPLKTKLENGDQVEIIRSNSPKPSLAWENIVVTGKARAEIRKFLKQQQREEYLTLGKTLLNKAFQQHGKAYNEKLLQNVLEKFKKNSVGELIVAVGEGVISRLDVINTLYPDTTGNSTKTLNPFSFLTRYKKKQRIAPPEAQANTNHIKIKGLVPGIAMHFANCCHPLPGDKIIGIVNTGKGITIHRVDCGTLDNFSDTPEKWIDVSWQDSGEQFYTGSIRLATVNESGTLAEITSIIATNEVNITNIKILSSSDDSCELLIELKIKGVNQLHTLVQKLKGLENVYSVERAKI